MIHPGENWKDHLGEPIRARGGSVIFHEETWWWFGVPKGDRKKPQGVRAYTSTNLVDWCDHGIVLAADEIPGGELDSPKVLRCPRTGGLVLWFHLVRAGAAGVAFAAAPGESFNFLHRVRGAGDMTREMTLFADDDGSVWHLFGREADNALHVARLDETLTRHESPAVRVATGGLHQAPAVMKWDGHYWLFAAGKPGWLPGEVCMATAPTIHGPWEVAGNPCVGTEAQVESCFHSRPACLVPVPGRTDAFVLVADGSPRRHVWLPLDFRHGVPEIHWSGAWDLSLWSPREKRNGCGNAFPHLRQN